MLGDYCFLLDFEGHIGDEVVADCLRDLKMKQGDIKFLGSYPAAGHQGEQVRRDSNANWRNAAIGLKNSVIKLVSEKWRRVWDSNPR